MSANELKNRIDSLKFEIKLTRSASERQAYQNTILSLLSIHGRKSNA